MGKWEVSETSHFLGQLLLRSMDRAVALYESMELRGFHGEFYYAEKVYKQTCILGICDFLGISIYFDENMLSHSAAGKNVCIESVDENDKI